jgi:hypothetical protein
MSAFRGRILSQWGRGDDRRQDDLLVVRYTIVMTSTVTER